MRPRILISSLLVIFVAAAACLTVYEMRTAAETRRMEWRKKSHHRPPIDLGPWVYVYYFYGSQRCSTCTRVEEYSYEALKKGFGKYMGDAQTPALIQWRPINMDEPENKHFVGDYKLYRESLILARDHWVGKYGEVHPSEWKNLDKIWDLAPDKSAFISYVQQEVRAYTPHGI